LSTRVNQGVPDLNFQATRVIAPVDVSKTEFLAPAMNVAWVGRPKLAGGAGARLIRKAWMTVPSKFEATTPQPALPFMMGQNTAPGPSGSR
jgi:hypothetical protein